MSNSDEIKNTYNKIAQAYHQKRLNPADSTWNDYLEKPAMEAMLKPLVKDKKVLDLGCGTGILTNELVAWGAEAEGVDLSEEMIALAKENYPEIKFTTASSENLPYPENSFDLAASSLVMHYLEDLQPTLVEIARVLKPAGSFIFSMHHPFNESFDLNKAKIDGRPVLQPYFHKESYYWRMCGADILSYHHTFEDIIKNLKAAGFVLFDMYECRPEISAKGKFAEYEFTSNYPTFCVFHAGLK